MPKTRLSAKNLGKHIRAADPWRSHAIAATVSAALRPGRQQVHHDVGQRLTYPKYTRLEASFRREIQDLLSRITTDQPSSKVMKAVFRKAYTTAFLLGKESIHGGVGQVARNISAEDKRWLEAFLTREYGLWTKFMDQVKNKTTKMDPKKRAEMYVQTLRSMYNTSRVLHSSPMALYYWETSPAEHCPHCLYLAIKSPFIKANLPTIPGSGDTMCLSSCKCHLRVAHPSVLEYQRVKKNAPTRDELLRGMRALKR